MRLPVETPLPATLGGYRLVRVLGRGPFATTALVHAGGEARVARVFERGADEAAMEAELAVHDALGDGPAEVRQHVAALDDLLTLADGRLVLLLAAATGPTLHDLLSARCGQLELGEAVTALAPLVAVVEGAHDLGVTGIPLDPRRIRFASSGAPVVVSVAGATAGAVLPARLREREPGYGDDHRAVAQLLRAVASAAREPASAAIRALAPRARGDRATATALFDLARPIPVRLDESDVCPAPVRTDGPESVVEPSDRWQSAQAAVGDLVLPATVRPAAVAAAVPVPPPAVPPPAAVRAVASALVAIGVPTRIGATVVQALESVCSWPGRMGNTLRARRLRAGRVTARGATSQPASSPLAPSPSASSPPAPVRRGVIIAGAGGGLALVLAIILGSISPATSDADTSMPSPSAVAIPDGASESSASSPVNADGSRLSREPEGAAAERGLPEDAARPEPGQWQGVVTELVRRWEDCRVQLDRAGANGSDDCADSVVQPRSVAQALLQDDDPRHGVLSAWLAQGGVVVVVERMGAAVLIDLVDPRTETTAASLLVMRSEAGWRVRDVLD